jgi:hypothetical protein
MLFCVLPAAWCKTTPLLIRSAPGIWGAFNRTMIASSSSLLPNGVNSSSLGHHLRHGPCAIARQEFGGRHQHTSTKASKRSDSAPSSKQPGKARQPRLVTVDGLGRKYEGLLQQKGIRTVDQLAEILLDKLSGPSVAAQQTSKQQGNGALAFLKVRKEPL